MIEIVAVDLRDVASAPQASPAPTGRFNDHDRGHRGKSSAAEK